ncbi:histidinol-phosphate transaminase [bacterium]|nr:histidinol-phosphate transaminase [bacterium]
MSKIRKSVLAMQGYVPGRQPKGSFVKLNANENPYPPSPKALEALGQMTGDKVRLYPSSSAEELRKAAAEVFGVPFDCIVAGNGSDDIFTMIIRSILDEGDTLAVVDPTYTLYETLAEIQGAKTERHPLAEDYALPESFFESGAKLKILPNPNAQTGTLFPEADIIRLCESAQGIVVIDEAYALFAGTSSVPLLKRFKNLVVTRTMSKSHSLAGMRVGFGMSSPEIIEAFMKVKDSYNLNAASQLMAAAAIKDTEYTAGVVAKLNETRNFFAKELVSLGWQVAPSHGNFLLAKPEKGSAAEIVDYLEKEGYLVRHFETPRLKDKIRFSIGTKEQMERLIELLKKYHSEVRA